MDTIDEGWVKLHRKILDNPVFKDPEALQLFIYCLLRANYKSNEILFNHQLVHLERGQFIFGLREASKKLKMSIKKLRNRLLVLEKLEILARKTTHRFSIITVENYNYYQDSENKEGHTEGHTEGTLRATDKKLKKVKNNTGRSKKQTDPRVKDFFGYWGKTFQKETGQPYVFTFGKEGKLVKGLLQVHPLEVLQDATRAFFQDDQCKRRGPTIGIFYQEVNRLIGLKGMDPLEQAKKELRERGN